MIHGRPNDLCVICGLAVAFALPPVAARAGALSVEDLQGISVHARVSYDMRVRKAEGTFNSQMTTVWKFKVDGSGRISGDLTHTVLTARGSRSRSRQMGGRIGKPGEPATGGHGLWLLEGDKLIALRTFDAGGFKAEISFPAARRRPAGCMRPICARKAPQISAPGSRLRAVR